MYIFFSVSCLLSYELTGKCNYITEVRDFRWLKENVVDVMFLYLYETSRIIYSKMFNVYIGLGSVMNMNVHKTFFKPFLAMQFDDVMSSQLHITQKTTQN